MLFWEREVSPRSSVETMYEGVAWKTRGGRFWRGPCPLHGGKDANFSVDAHTLLPHCFSQCGSGSLFAFLNGGQEPRGEAWVQALRDLARFAGVPFPERALSDETRARLDENNRRAHLLESFAAFGAQSLLAPSAQVARDYLEARGFSPDMWANLPLEFFPSRKGVRAQLQGRGFSHEKIEASGAALGVRSLVVCLDNDSKPDGRFVGQERALHIAELALVPRSVRNTQNVDVCGVADVLSIVDVLPSVWLEAFKDADAFVRAKGLEAFERLLPERQSAVTFVALTRLEGISPASPEAARCGAVETLLQLDVRLSGPRAPLDRDELRQLAGLRTGFLPESLAQIGDEWARLERLRARKRALETWARNLNREVAGANEEEIEPLLSRVAGEMAALWATEKAAPLPFSVARLDEESRRQSAGKSSGWAPLDALGVRFGAGEFALIGARTGHGKTSFLVALLQRWPREENDETLLFFSLEEPEVRIYHRLLSLGTAQEAAREGVRQGRALAGWMVPQVRDWTRDARGRGELHGPPDPHWLERARDGLRSRERQLQIVSNSDWGLDDMEAYARQLSQKRVWARSSWTICSALPSSHRGDKSGATKNFRPSGGASKPSPSTSVRPSSRAPKSTAKPSPKAFRAR